MISSLTFKLRRAPDVDVAASLVGPQGRREAANPATAMLDRPEALLWTSLQSVARHSAPAAWHPIDLPEEGDLNLLDYATHAAVSRGLPVEITVPESRAHQRRRLEARGFRAVSTFHRLSLTGPRLRALTPAPLEAGMRLEHASAERFRRLHNAAIAGCEGLLPLEAATVAQWYAAPDFDPRDWQVLTCGEHDLAYVSMGLEETEQGQAGHVYMLGVAPQWHGQGIGLSLLARACALLRDRGALEVLLGAEFCSPEALALYHEIGFVTRYAAVRYRLQQPTATLEI